MTKFITGTSGNPSGKKKGTLNKRTQLAKLLEPHAQELIEKAVELARNGDVNALRLCIERLIPKAKNEMIVLPISIDDTKDPEKLLGINSAIIQGVISGELTPEQGKAISGIVEKQTEFLFFTDVNKRVKDLEKLAPKMEKQDVKYYLD